MKLNLIYIILFLLIAEKATAQIEWVQVQNENSDFQYELPVQPEFKHDSPYLVMNKLKVESSIEIAYIYQRDSVSFHQHLIDMINHFGLDSNLMPESINSKLLGLKMAYTKMFENTIIINTNTDITTPSDSIEAEEIEYKFENNSKEKHCFVRMYCSQYTSNVFFIMANEAELVQLTNLKERYFASISWDNY